MYMNKITVKMLFEIMLQGKADEKTPLHDLLNQDESCSGVFSLNAKVAGATKEFLRMTHKHSFYSPRQETSSIDTGNECTHFFG